MKTFFAFTKQKLLFSVIIFLITFVLSFGLYQLNPSNFNFTNTIFIPFQVDYLFYPLFYTVIPGDDVTRCAIPLCHFFLPLLTILLSAGIYYLLACILVALTKKFR